MHLSALESLLMADHQVALPALTGTFAVHFYLSEFSYKGLSCCSFNVVVFE